MSRTDPICIDVSHWQEPDGSSPWPRLRKAGIRGVILKATEGDSYIDPTFRERYEAALEEGFPVCGYHFLRPGNMQTQMSHFVETVQPINGERLVLDHEDPGVSLSDLKDAVQALIDFNPSLQITIYSGYVIKEQIGQDEYDPWLSGNTSLWLAHYTTGEPTWPRGTWAEWSLWQYTDQGTVDGYGPLDLNRFNGSDREFVRWMTPVSMFRPVEEPNVVVLSIASDEPVRMIITAGRNVTVVT